MKTKCKFFVGTSGFHYEHWKGRFYPEDLNKNEWLFFYAESFQAVELNNTFYRLPKDSTFQSWYNSVPDDFIFVVKANRYITHLKRLKDVKEPLERFLRSISGLKDKLGPVLYQLPPNMKMDICRLSDFLKLLPKGQKSAFEFRHQSWYCAEIFELLEQFNCALCIHDLGAVKTPKVITADFAYIRLHGPLEKYAGCYSTQSLSAWAKWIKKNSASVKNIYVFFNNDYNAYAIKNAQKLKQLLFK